MNDEPILGFPPGVQSLDHAADVGLRIHAPDLPALLDRAARGMIVLLAGEEHAAPPGEEHATPGERSAARGEVPALSGEGRAPKGESPAAGREQSHQEREREISVSAIDSAQLLADWLRELLYLYEVYRLEYAEATFNEVVETRVRASVSLRAAAESPDREIKGVTYHGLEAVRRRDGWHASVIFDV